jgi:hypothetical protein
MLINTDKFIGEILIGKRRELCYDSGKIEINDSRSCLHGGFLHF